MIFLTAGRTPTGWQQVFGGRSIASAGSALPRHPVFYLSCCGSSPSSGKDTVGSLARRMPYSDFKLKRFEVLNGISRNDRLRRGQKLKMVMAN
jgi:hypothetical protein